MVGVYLYQPHFFIISKAFQNTRYLVLPATSWKSTPFLRVHLGSPLLSLNVSPCPLYFLYLFHLSQSPVNFTAVWPNSCSLSREMIQPIFTSPGASSLNVTSAGKIIVAMSVPPFAFLSPLSGVWFSWRSFTGTGVDCALFLQDLPTRRNHHTVS